MNHMQTDFSALQRAFRAKLSLFASSACRFRSLRLPGTFPVWLHLFALVIAPNVPAQTGPDNPKYEFRGAWIATVVNLDWPVSNTLSTSRQQEDLVRLFDELHDAGFNAVMFQIRSEADAMYGILCAAMIPNKSFGQLCLGLALVLVVVTAP